MGIVIYWKFSINTSKCSIKILHIAE